MTNLGDRIVVLIDMDCFFCQVEAKLQPELKGKPLAVVQYGSFGPSSIIAVNYEARNFGVTRHMKGAEAKEKCPDIILVTVPPLRNKPDTGRYRSAGREVIEVLKKKSAIIERASIDEAYLDITSLVEERMNSIDQSQMNIVEALSNTFVVGYCDDNSNDEEKRKYGIETWMSEVFGDLGDVQSKKLAIAGMLVEEFRGEIWSQCQYRCSAGISYNKILAKLACGLHKPNRQTILPAAAVPGLYHSLPVKKVRNLGGKFGNIVVESLGCNVMADLLRYSLQDLQKRFGDKTGSWLYNIARGIDNETVTNKLICKSIGSSKNFPGKAAITKLEDLKKWVVSLTEEMVERLEQDMEENERRATHLSLSYHWYQDKKIISQSKSCPLTSYKIDRIANLCVDIITKATQKPVAFIGMSAGKFVAARGSGNFVNFFNNGGSKLNELKVKSIEDPSELIKSKIVVKGSDLQQIEDNSSNAKVNPYQASLKTYARKKKIVHHKEEQKNNLNNFFISKQETNDINITIPQVMDQKSNLQLSLDIPKTLDDDNFKNSFFMNALKDSESPAPAFSFDGSSLDYQNTKKLISVEILKSNSDESEIKSPDLFDDCEPEENPSTSDMKNYEEQEEEKINSKEEDDAVAQLKEIFPDLDNIDTSVLQLLPIELQRAANNYLKSSKISSLPSSSNKKETKIITKNKATKSKGSSTKVSHKNGIIMNFFVNNSSNFSDVSSKKQCPECSQMIIASKFQEHCDFHVAENLQRMINHSTQRDSGNSTGGNHELSHSQYPGIKRKLSIETPPPSKKSRNIQSFFT
uniref:DNA polymerase eta n=1 Tax=Fopius arisanus TaxID=64838 RepID=A0A0C9RHZ1_9HYME